MTGSSCEQARFQCRVGGLSCSPLHDYTNEVSQGCVDFNAPFNGDVSCITGPTNVMPGACTPSGVEFTNKTPFQQVVDLCEAPSTSAGCPASDTCVARPPSDRSAVLCIEGESGQSCPTGWGVPVDAFGGGDDQRACTPCNCVPQDGTGHCTEDVYSLAQAAGCNDFGPFPTFGGGGCVSYDMPIAPGGSWSFLREPGSLTMEGSCAASGGDAMGSVVVQSAVTICCAPPD